MMKNSFTKSKLSEFLDNKFSITKRGSTLRQETLGGVINFLVMVYVMIVIPNILTGGGLHSEQVWNALFLATIVTVIITTLALAFKANLPLVSAPGIGLSSYFATLMQNGVYTFSQTLTIALLASLIFIMLTMLGFRKKLINSLPNVLKVAIPAGIGLFILNIGLNSSNSKIIEFLTNGPTHIVGGEMVVISAIVAIFGFMVIAVLSKKKVKAAIFYGIVSATILHFILQFSLGVNPFASLEGAKWLPQFGNLFNTSFLNFDFKGTFVGDGTNIAGSIMQAVVVIFSYILVDLFDTVGTLFGATKNTSLVNENGEIEKANTVFWIDSISTAYGAMIGVPGCTVYVESSAGIMAGARTGFSSLIVAGLFVLSLFLAPIFMLIPVSATAPALMFVGVQMFKSVVDVNFESVLDYLPAIATIIIMPLTNNIAFGIGAGLIMYVVLMLFSKQGKKVNFITYLLALLFVVFFATQNIF